MRKVEVIGLLAVEVMGGVAENDRERCTKENMETWNSLEDTLVSPVPFKFH